MTNADWIKLNLPPVAAFSKNGVTLTVDAAVTGALTDNADNKYLALADLLDMLAANVQYKSETLDDYKYDQPTIFAAAAYWRAKGEETAASDAGSDDISVIVPYDYCAPNPTGKAIS